MVSAEGKNEKEKQKKKKFSLSSPQDSNTPSRYLIVAKKKKKNRESKTRFLFELVSVVCRYLSLPTKPRNNLRKAEHKRYAILCLV